MTVQTRIEIPGRTIVDALRNNAQVLGHRPALRHRAGGGWQTLTWAEYSGAVTEVAAGLAELGIGEGETAGILSANRMEWHFADHGSLANRSVVVPVYPTSSPEQVAYILGHSGARVVFVEDDVQLGKVEQVRHDLPKLDRAVVFDSVDSSDHPFAVSFSTLRALGRARLVRDPDSVARRAALAAPDDVATLVYTSGTTGPPKGAMITHANIMWTLRHATLPFEIRPGERFLSFLPLSHIAERMMSDFLPIAIGGETWFARSLATVAEDLHDVRPTVFFAVPRVWEKFHDAILEKVSEESPTVRRLVDAYVTLGLRRVEAEQAGRVQPGATRAAHRVLDAVIGRKIRRQVGLDEAHVLITAAAPIHPDLIRWFHALGLPLLELYGQTEDCGPTTANVPSRNKIGTVGPPISGVTIDTAADGEVLVRGGNVCSGYLDDPASTAELIDEDGWMHTGDLGEIDADGYLTITGRKKDLIITAAGKNIAPQEIELDLRYHSLIAQAVVAGEGRKYLTTLVTLDPDALVPWAEAHDKVVDVEALAADPDLHAEIDAAIAAVNAKRSHAEGIRKFHVLPHDFTIAEGELTPTLKVKRNVVYAKYADVIDSMYAEPAEA